MAKQVKHEQRAHALLSASGASRWINCTPSPRLEESFKESSSSYAAEGTLAHEFGDIYLQYNQGLLTKAAYNKQLKKLRANELYTDEMEGQVEKYTTHVLEQLAEAKSKTEGALLLIEERLDFSHVVEDGFGTGDGVVIADGTMEVIDLKYGKGVPVYADHNSQLKLYGLGALRAHELSYDIHTVKLTIVQPRLDSISSWELSSDELNEWAETVVKPAAKKAFAGEGEQVPGDWCRWCKAKARCKALANQNLEIAKLEFADPALLNDQELIEVFEQIPQLQTWAKSVSEYLLKEALAGRDWPGYKVVEGRSNRKWQSEEAVVEKLDELGLSPDDYMKSKLEGITKVSSLFSVDKFEEHLGPLVIKPQGKPTLVKESDKRPAFGVDQAKKDFSE